MADIDRLSDVQVGVLKSLRLAVRENVDDLDNAANSGRISTVAWLARNLLELAIWCQYCTRSETNAKQFLLDAARDIHDALNVPDGILSPTFSFRTARADSVERAQQEGFETLDQRFTSVHSIAHELQQDDLYKTYNKLLSKFAHPTALSVIENGSPMFDGIKVKIHKIGTVFATAAEHFIENRLAELGNS